MACPGVGQVSAAQINQAAAQLGVPCWVVLAQITLESGGNPGAVSPAGAEGVAQFLPSTWAGTGCAGSPFNVADSMACYVKFMGQLLRQFGGNTRDALAAYNAGPGNIGAGMGYADSILAGHGNVQAGKGSNVQTAQLAAKNIPNPLNLIDDLGKAVGSLFSGPVSIADSVQTIGQILGTLARTLNTMFDTALWLFKPSNWIRIIAFVFGIGLLLPGVWMLSKAGKGEGDLSLALGILLVMFAGVLLFVAFHSLPTDVNNLGALLGYISSDIRRHSPATTG
jgi:hypothetical protein